MTIFKIWKPKPVAIPRKWGVQVHPGASNPDRMLELAKFLRPGALVFIPVWWYEHEEIPGTFDFSALDKIMQVYSDYDVIFGVRNAPDWAREFPECENSPVRLDRFEHYLRFCLKLIQRYSPWGIEHWNEPDGPRLSTDLAHWLGGFGGNYAGGQKYGAFCNVVGKRLKVQKTKVIVGAQGWMDQTEFLAGFASVFNKDYCDWLSYHGYADYQGSGKGWVFRIFNMSRLLSYYFAGIPQICTETSLLHVENNCELAAFEEEQAEYLKILDRSPARPEDLRAVLWFGMRTGWRSADLLGKGDREKPVFEVWEGLL